MILRIHSNAGYCNEKNAQSKAGGHLFLSNNDQLPPNNEAIMTNATIIKVVMSLAAEAKLGALFLNTKEAGISPANTHQNGPSATTHPDPDQQHSGERSNKQ
jgi:hypothetical protein